MNSLYPQHPYQVYQDHFFQGPPQWVTHEKRSFFVDFLSFVVFVSVLSFIIVYIIHFAPPAMLPSTKPVKHEPPHSPAVPVVPTVTDASKTKSSPFPYWLLGLGVLFLAIGLFTRAQTQVGTNKLIEGVLHRLPRDQTEAIQRLVELKEERRMVVEKKKLHELQLDLVLGMHEVWRKDLEEFQKVRDDLLKEGGWGEKLEEERNERYRKYIDEGLTDILIDFNERARRATSTDKAWIEALMKEIDAKNIGKIHQKFKLEFGIGIDRFQADDGPLDENHKPAITAYQKLNDSLKTGADHERTVDEENPIYGLKQKFTHHRLPGETLEESETRKERWKKYDVFFNSNNTVKQEFKILSRRLAAEKIEEEQNKIDQIDQEIRIVRGFV